MPEPVDRTLAERARELVGREHDCPTFVLESLVAQLADESDRLRERFHDTLHAQFRAHTVNHGCSRCAEMFGSPEQQGDYGLCSGHRHELEAERDRYWNLVVQLHDALMAWGDSPVVLETRRAASRAFRAEKESRNV